MGGGGGGAAAGVTRGRGSERAEIGAGYRRASRGAQAGADRCVTRSVVRRAGGASPWLLVWAWRRACEGEWRCRPSASSSSAWACKVARPQPRLRTRYRARPTQPSPSRHTCMQDPRYRSPSNPIPDPRSRRAARPGHLWGGPARPTTRAQPRGRQLGGGQQAAGRAVSTSSSASSHRSSRSGSSHAHVRKYSAAERIWRGSSDARAVGCCVAVAASADRAARAVAGRVAAGR